MLLNGKCDRIWWQLGTLVSLAICCMGYPVCLQEAGVSWGASPAVVVSHPGFWHCLNGPLLAELSNRAKGCLCRSPSFCLKGVQLLNLGQMQPEASSSLQTAAADGGSPFPQTDQWTNQSVAFPHLAWERSWPCSSIYHVQWLQLLAFSMSCKALKNKVGA